MLSPLHGLTIKLHVIEGKGGGGFLLVAKQVVDFLQVLASSVNWWCERNHSHAGPQCN